MSDTPQQPTIQSLDAVVLIANDFRRQCEFYGNTLGLPATNTYEDAAFFSAGNQSLAVFAHSHHPEGTERLKGGSHGLSHIEFGIQRSDRASMIEHLHKLGAHAYGENFQDADGNLFHFNLR